MIQTRHFKRLQGIQAKYESWVRQHANVGMDGILGIGHKHIKGKSTKVPCLIVGVTKKMTPDEIGSHNMIPGELDGELTDIIQTGRIIAFGDKKRRGGLEPAPPQNVKAQAIDTTTKHRPMMPGISIGHRCYDPKTRVMTSEGLKLISNVTTKDEIATLNPDGALEWQNPVTIMEYDYEGDMLAISQRTIDLLVTPEHNLFCKNRNVEMDFELIPAAEAFARYPFDAIQFKRNCTWHCSDTATQTIPAVGHNVAQYLNSKDWKGTIAKQSKEQAVPYKTLWRWKHGKTKPRAFKNPLEFKIEDWLEFLGWYLAEGSTSKNSVVISEKSKRYHEEITSLLSRMKIRSHVTSENNIVFTHRSLAEYVKRFGTASSKYIPKTVKDLPPKKLKILLDAIMKGDGHFENEHYRSYKTVSEQLAFDVLEIGLKCGLGVTIQDYDPKEGGTVEGRTIIGRHRSYRVGFSHSKLTPRLTKPPKRITYKGKVHCLEVPNHVLFVERNGKTCWCGNSITAGTLGFVAIDTTTGEQVIVSNNHVGAMSDDGVAPPEATIGDQWVQPGPTDWADDDDLSNTTVATLLRWVPIKMLSGGGGGPPRPNPGLGCPGTRALAAAHNGLYAAGQKLTLGKWFTTRIPAIMGTLDSNEVDVSIAKLIAGVSTNEVIPEIGKPTGFVDAASASMLVDHPVHKHGRTTGYTTGTARVVNGTVTVNYGGGNTARFINQVLFTPMSEPGDSGSLILTQASEDFANGVAAAHLFAGSTDVTIGNPIWKTLELMNLELPV